MNFRPLAAATFLILALASTVPGAHAEEIVSSVWHSPLNVVNTAGYRTLKERVPVLSDGELSIRHITGPALLPAVEHLTGLQDGVIGIGVHAGTYTPKELPEDNLISIFAMRFGHSLATALAYTEFWMTDAVMIARQKALGIVFGGAVSTRPYSLICTKPRTTLAELEGAKLRSAGPSHAGWARSAGLVPISVPSTEAYDGLAQGDLDCAALFPSGLEAYSLWDVAKHVTLLPELGPYFSGWLFAANRGMWNGLSSKNRRALLNAFAEGTVAFHLADIRDEERVTKLAKEQYNVTFHNVAKEVTESAELFADEGAMKLAKRAATERFGMSEVEAVQIIERFTTTYQRWLKLLNNTDLTNESAVLALVKKHIYDRLDENTYGVD